MKTFYGKYFTSKQIEPRCHIAIPNKKETKNSESKLHWYLWCIRKLHLPYQLKKKKHSAPSKIIKIIDTFWDKIFSKKWGLTSVIYEIMEKQAHCKFMSYCNTKQERDKKKQRD